MSRLKAQESVAICEARHVEKVQKDALIVKEERRVSFGICVWAVGNKACKLVEEPDVRNSKKGIKRVLADCYLRVLQPDGSKSDAEILEDDYAPGDASDIERHLLPTTAEIAVQKAKWLAKYLNAGEVGGEFEYKNKALVAYIRRGDGVVGGNVEWTGTTAWLAWRSGSLEWTRGWRRKAMIVVYWVANWIDGQAGSGKEVMQAESGVGLRF